MSAQAAESVMEDVKVVVDWANTPARRQLMGIHAVDGRAGWDRHDVPYLPEHEAIARAKVI